MAKGYQFKEIEAKWQRLWEERHQFKAEMDPRKKKYYVLEMFPYPSGEMHMGHVENYVIGDVIARYKRMRGLNILHPMGWDAFGLPGENAALKKGIHPAEYIKGVISRWKAQMKRLGLSYDWDREVTTCEPDYYKWTQWLFLKLYRKGLAYKRLAPVNWCPSCSTTLANEEVIDGRCARCETAVTQKELEQWFFKITDYAQKLLDDLDSLKQWPERVKIMQRNWIGRSEGVEIDFRLEDTDEILPCFTTRPDTIYGVTYLALAPEHAIVKTLTKGSKGKEIINFVRKVRGQNIAKRSLVEKEGIFTGKRVINPINEDRVPLWITNYALMEYGTGAVMAVPAHDQRDFEFARKYDLPIKLVIQDPDRALDPHSMECAYVEDGIQVNSQQFDKLSNREAMERIADYLEEKEIGRRKISYRLRDWLISRQRYWGAPIPIIYCPECGTVPIPDEDLPVLLPQTDEIKPKGESPLARVPEFVNTSCPNCGKRAKRETDTIAQWLCSCWYFLRYASPHSKEKPFDKREVDYWLPVDQYTGGIEHAIKHLLYSRFLIKVLREDGEISFQEPFINLLTHGMVLLDGKVMSSSKGVVVEPDKIIKRYGADATRLFTLFASPPEKELEWSEKGIQGASRFLNRIWRLVNEFRAQSLEFREKGLSTLNSQFSTDLHRRIHQTIKKVTNDIEERFHFNTAIAAIMELENSVRTENRKVMREALEKIVLLLAPMVPHLAEELWQRMGKSNTIFEEPWPVYDEEMVKTEKIMLIVEVNGKVRARIDVPAELDEEGLKKVALEDERIKKWTKGKKIKKVIVVPKKLVNIVV